MNPEYYYAMCQNEIFNWCPICLDSFGGKKCRNVLKSLHFVGRAEVKRWKFCFLFMCLSSFDYIETHFPNWGFVFFLHPFYLSQEWTTKKLPFNSQKDRNIRQNLKSPIDIDMNRFLFFFECFFLIFTKMPGKKNFPSNHTKSLLLIKTIRLCGKWWKNCISFDKNDKQCQKSQREKHLNVFEST